MPDPTLNELKTRILRWASAFPYCAFLDSCQSQTDRFGQYELLVGIASASTEVVQDPGEFRPGNGNWHFGHLSYELKDIIEPSLTSQLPASIAVPLLHFFRAEMVLAIRKGEAEPVVLLGDEEVILGEIKAIEVSFKAVKGEFTFLPSVSKQNYLDQVRTLKNHIREGDVYEINLCQEFSAPGTIEDPAAVFRRLTQVSPTPFAAFLRLQHIHALCASPERFLRLDERTLITQPIKGTAPRGHSQDDDSRLKQELLASEKERAENVMIVDLARNDLYRSSETNSVSVPYLFEIQTFPKVHHLVSTVTGTLAEGTSPLQAIFNAFPPGSMTGAPKVKSMELIEQYEASKRGIYSGSIGYFDPKGNFDLNVVIRTLCYNSQAKKLSYHVGGAITWGSDPLAEYEETLLKARALRQTLQS